MELARRCAYGLLLFASVLSTISGQGNARLSCYYASWAYSRPDIGSYTIDDIPTDLCTHLIYAFIGISNKTWEIIALDEDNDVTNGGFTKFVALKEKNPNLNVAVALGGWGEGGQKYSEMVSVKERRDSAIASIIAFLNQYGFDGIDLDWEYPGAVERGGSEDDKQNFFYFVEELRAAFNKEGKNWEITLAAPVAQARLDDGYFAPDLCQNVDFIHAMSYDLRGSWGGYADVHSPLFRRKDDTDADAKLNVNDGVHLWMEYGCPSYKMLVGIPFYGETYKLKEGNSKFEPGPNTAVEAGGSEPGPYTQSENTKAYYEICQPIMEEGGWTEGWEEGAFCPYTYKDLNWIGYENPSSVAMKADFIRQSGLAGAMVWSLDLDDFNGLCGEKNILLNTLKKGLEDYVVPPPMDWSTTPRPDWDYPSSTGNPTTTTTPSGSTTTTPIDPTGTTPTISTSTDPTGSTSSTSTSSPPTGTTPTIGPTTSTELPPGVPDCSKGGDYFPAVDCSKYYRCDHGQAVEFSCDPPLIWIQTRLQCDFKEHADRPECA